MLPDFISFLTLFAQKQSNILYLQTLTKFSLIKINIYPIFVYFFISCGLSIIILLFSYFLVYQNPETEKLSSYECGFEPYEDARQSFDIKFYLIAILFLIFDIETVFLFPWSISLNVLDIVGYWVIIDFVIELGIGYIYIWYIKALNW